MGQWVRLCAAGEAPAEGTVREADAGEHVVCLARIGGELRAIDNRCPHRDGPLGQGWVEGNTVVCPWHAWAFDTTTGVVEEPEHGKVAVYPVRVEGEEVFVEIPA